MILDAKELWQDLENKYKKEQAINKNFLSASFFIIK